MRAAIKIILPVVAFSFFLILSKRVVQRLRNAEYIEPYESDLEEAKRIASSHPPIHLASILCDVGTAQYFSILLHSSILNSYSQLNFHLVIESFSIRNVIENLLNKLPESIKFRIKVDFHEMRQIPKKEWNATNQKCIYQQVFFPEIFQNLERVIYLNPGSLIVGPLEKIWAQFDQFNPNEIVSASNDCPYEGCGYFGKVLSGKAHVPAVWESGMNSAIMLYKLDKMRALNTTGKINDIALSGKYQVVYIDQDLFNIFFSLPENQNRLRHLDCIFNFMAWFYCLEPTICHVHDGLFVINPGNHVDGGLFEFLKNKIADMNFNRNKENLISDLIESMNNFKARDACPKVIKYLFWKK